MDFILEGHEFIHMDQKNKGGGGIALYVDNNFNIRVLVKMSLTVDNVLECIIEVYNDKNKSGLISCL